jgi:hypothetical protein
MGGIELYGVTKEGERIEGPCFTGIELVAVALTRDDDKPGLEDILTADVFPRMSGANPRELLSLVEDWRRKGLPHCLSLNVDGRFSGAVIPVL